MLLNVFMLILNERIENDLFILKWMPMNEEYIVNGVMYSCGVSFIFIQTLQLIYTYLFNKIYRKHVKMMFFETLYICFFGIVLKI